MYTVSFEDCDLHSPLQSRSPESTLALALEAQRNGCSNVTVTLPDGEILPLRAFADTMHERLARPDKA